MIWLILLGSTIGIIWHLPMLLLIMTPFILHKSSDRGEITSVQNKKPRSSIFYKGKPFGYICGRWYFGLIDETAVTNGTSTSMWIVCTTKKWDELTADNTSKHTHTITVWEFIGNFFWIDYKSRTLGIDKFKSRYNQKRIVKDICGRFKDKGKCVAFVSSGPGEGKSTLGLLIAKKLNAHFCNTWNPSKPGFMLSDLYRCVNPTDEKPLVVLLDEIDEIISKFPIADHKHVPTQITDKLSWNALFDDIDRDLYPKLIILLTSNQRKSDFESSLLRNGRVDLDYLM